MKNKPPLELPSDISKWPGFCEAASINLQMVLAHPNIIRDIIFALDSQRAGNKLRGEKIESLKKSLKDVIDFSEGLDE